MAKIYVASSWRNEYQPDVVRFLQEHGHQVYDFRHPAGRTGFQWSDIDEDWEQWGADQYKKALNHPIAEAGFKSDFDAMQWADVCVLMLPCGRSAHAEAGWMKGAGKKVFVFQIWQEEPELMYKLFDGVCSTANELCVLLEAFEKEQKATDIKETEYKAEKWKGVQVYTPTFPDGAIMIKVDDSIERPVAIVPMPVGGHKNGTNIQRKNAALIAAAPELLDACEDVLPFFTQDDAEYDTLFDVIVKARNEQFDK